MYLYCGGQKKTTNWISNHSQKSRLVATFCLENRLGWAPIDPMLLRMVAKPSMRKKQAVENEDLWVVMTQVQKLPWEWKPEYL